MPLPTGSRRPRVDRDDLWRTHLDELWILNRRGAIKSRLIVLG